MPDAIWFWQRIVSPHMAGLAKALAESRDVVYVAERPMSASRRAMGWADADLGNAELRVVSDADQARALALSAPHSSIHICQGLRGNGTVGPASDVLARRSLRRWVVMETVEDRGCKGKLRRLEYRRLLLVERRRLEGILATGDATADWLVARGMPRERVFPFAYFLPQPSVSDPAGTNVGPLQVVFVGQLIHRKRVDLLIDAVAALGPGSADLTIVGSGPLEDELRRRGEEAGLNIRWMGTRPMAEISSLMAEADCLVLPSRHDGWGAVASEAMMVGTPVICSDACGSAGVVRASGRGYIFESGSLHQLSSILRNAVARGPLESDERAALSRWARCLGAQAGAMYLTDILDMLPGSERPRPPWEVA